MRVTAVGTSLSDVVVSCGGTLLRYADADHQVSVIALSRPPAAAGGAEDGVGAELQRRLNVDADNWFGLDMDSVDDDKASRDLLTDVFRVTRPDVILGPANTALRPDSRTLAQLVFGAAYCACVPNYPSLTDREAVSVRAVIAQGDPVTHFASGTPEYVDINDVWERKLELLDAVSPPVEDQGGATARETAEICARARGVQVQMPFAEAFGHEPAWGRLRTHRLLP